MSSLQRKIRHVTKSDYKRAMDKHELECDMCHAEIIVVSQDVNRVICDYCVQSMVLSPNAMDPKKVVTGYPQGWHLKKLYVSEDGKYFCKGKEIPKPDTTKPEIVSKKIVAKVKSAKKIKTGKKVKQVRTVKKKKSPSKG
jgi:hypothetical protein